MRKHAVLLTLLLFEALALVLFAGFWLVMRRELMATYGASPPGESSVRLPVLTGVALSGWFAPVAAGLGAALGAASFWPRVGARRRVSLASAGLIVTVFALAFAVLAGYSPVLAPLGAP